MNRSFYYDPDPLIARLSLVIGARSLKADTYIPMLRCRGSSYSVDPKHFITIVAISGPRQEGRKPEQVQFYFEFADMKKLLAYVCFTCLVEEGVWRVECGRVSRSRFHPLVTQAESLAKTLEKIPENTEEAIGVIERLFKIFRGYTNPS